VNYAERSTNGIILSNCEYHAQNIVFVLQLQKTLQIWNARVWCHVAKRNSSWAWSNLTQCRSAV